MIESLKKLNLQGNQLYDVPGINEDVARNLAVVINESAVEDFNFDLTYVQVEYLDGEICISQMQGSTMGESILSVPA